MAGADAVNGRSSKFAASEVVPTTDRPTNCEEKVGKFQQRGSERGREGQGRTKEGLSKSRVYTLQQLLSAGRGGLKGKQSKSAHINAVGG